MPEKTISPKVLDLEKNFYEGSESEKKKSLQSLWKLNLSKEEQLYCLSWVETTLYRDCLVNRIKRRNDLKIEDLITLSHHKMENHFPFYDKLWIDIINDMKDNLDDWKTAHRKHVLRELQKKVPQKHLDEFSILYVIIGIMVNFGWMKLVRR